MDLVHGKHSIYAHRINDLEETKLSILQHSNSQNAGKFPNARAVNFYAGQGIQVFSVTAR